MIDKFLSLVKNPAFNPAECTLHSVADIHSYSCTFRKAIGNSVFEDSSLQTIPMFVWEEVLVRIGSQWVAHVHKLCDDAVQEVNAIGWERDIFERILVDHQSTIDLRCASLVHRSWTRPAQRQLGRVLVLHDEKESTLASAIRSNLYGTWTQVLAINGSTAIINTGDPWGIRKEVTDTLLPNLTFLKTIVARLPCLTMLHFESSYMTHPLVLLTAMKTLVSLETISIINIGETVNKSTLEILMRIQD